MTTVEPSPWSVSRFSDEVRAVLADLPYRVEPRPDGFDVVLDVLDEEWWKNPGLTSLDSSYVHQVRVAGDTWTLTDVQYHLRWRNGRPIPGGPVRGQREVAKEFSWQISWAPRTGEVTQGSFSTETARRRIEDVATRSGLRRERTAAQVLLRGVVFGAGAVAVLALVAAFVGVLGSR